MFKLILVLALAGSAFANYGQQQQMRVELPRAPPAIPTRSYGNAPEIPRPMAEQTPVASSYGGYGKAPEVTRPMAEQSNLNPCTEEVMRAMEIQLFAHPEDETKYIICTDVGIFTTMPCSPGTVFNQELRHCIPVGWEAPVCPLGTCLNEADCFLNEFGEPKCNCRVGFTGERCEVNIDECMLEGNAICQSEGGICVDQINAFYCAYDGGAFIGFSRAESIRAPCSIEELSNGKQFYELITPLKNIYVQCTGENMFVVSRCADMLFWHQELRTCSIERPAEKTGVCQQYPCKNDGECLDLGNNNFECKCKEGFSGALCEEPIDFCLNMPCGSGRCVSHTGGYNCVCQNNIVAQSCDLELRNPCTDELRYAPCDNHPDMYFSCDFGLAFLKNCAPGLLWRQDLLTCRLAQEVKPPMMFPGRPPMMAPSMQSYGSYKQPEVPRREPAPLPPVTTQSYGYRKPEVPRREPVPVITTTLPPPPPPVTTQSYGYRKPEVPQSTFRSFMPQVPQMQAPRMQTPQMQAPRMQMPQMQAPQMQAPQMQAPRMQMPQLPTSARMIGY